MAKGNTGRGKRRDDVSKKSASDAQNSKSIEASNQRPKASSITKGIQQKCLDIFTEALNPSNDDASILQEVKGHLYNRDFATAFGKDEYLRVYASRWSPTRSLAYLQVFEDVAKDVPVLMSSSESDDSDPAGKVVCIGGGAGGELVALAVWLNSGLDPASELAYESLQVTLIDIANWNPVATVLHNGITIPPVLSKYASQAKKDANSALMKDEEIIVTLKQMDVLDADQRDVLAEIATADLVTLMFTLNELYTSSMSKTQHLLSDTLSKMPANSCLLVVDSPGSYSTVSINGAEKKYPMHWLLDYTLLGDPRTADDQNAKWTKVRSEDSKWFRLPAGLEYPIDLEDMRYQLHLYRRLADTGS